MCASWPRWRSQGALGVAISLTVLLPALLPAQDATLDADLTPLVGRMIGELLLVPGLAVAVVRGDRVIYERGFGFGDRESRRTVTPETVFYVASLAKAFTGMTAAVLAERGELDLDAPLSRIFPALRFRPPLSADSVTVRDLLRHAPGFTNGAVNWVAAWVRPYSEPELVDVLGRWSDPAPRRFGYSNTNYAVVGYVINRVTGEPWQRVMSRRVFEPLGMRSSTAWVSAVDRETAALPYVAGRSGLERLPWLKSDSANTGAGGIFSTARDLARFVIANLNHGRVDGVEVLPAEAVAAAQSPQIDVDATFFEFRRRAYGLGFYLADYDGDVLVHHFGGYPGYRSHLSFMPERGMGVVVLQNEGGDGSAVADIVATYVYDRLRGKADARERAEGRIAALSDRVRRARESRAEAEDRLARLKVSPASPALALSSYAGHYHSDRLGDVEVRLEGGSLSVSYGRLGGRLLPGGGNEFLVDWIPGEPATFVFAVTDGRVTGFQWSGRPFERVER